MYRNVCLKVFNDRGIGVAGRIMVEILDESGASIEGYSPDDCDGLIGDEISWKGSTDLSKISGKPVNVPFVMNDADIYPLRLLD